MKTKINNRFIEFFDGETVNNKYVLLGNSENYIINKKGLTLEQSLDFLFDYSESINYFFRISYDLNMIFSGEEITGKTQDFFNSIEVNFYGYDLLYFTDKILIITKEGKRKKFFDVSNFFHKSFIKTLEILKIELSEKDSSFLSKYKNLRAGFQMSDLENIVNYNKLECNLGLKIVQSLFDLIPVDLQTLSLYGASSITNKFLMNNEIHKKNNIFNFYNAEKFLLTYFGGRMESLKIGTFKNCYKYDINSAYPNVIKDLREIEKITEKEYKNQKVKKENIYLIELKINDKNLIGLLPFRLKSGYIIFPNEVNGWYYGSEILQVIEYKKYYDVELKIKKFLDIKLSDKIFPNKEIEGLFFKRNIFKQKNDLRNFIYKILLNSIYGKFAQRVGSAKFQNLYYAGFITSETRAELLKAVIKNPYEVIFFATDGILIKNKLKLKTGVKLGEWEEIKIKESKVLLSGVYKCIDENNKIYLGERGFNFNFDEVFAEIIKTGKAKIKQNIFIGNKYYFKNQKAFNKYRCKFKEITKEINPKNQIKRIYLNELNLKKENNSFIFNSDNIKELNNNLIENHFSESNMIFDE
jgi:hypothetical protein